MLVIAKAYGDEPLVRILTGCQSGLAYVVNPSAVEHADIAALSGVGFPQTSVFRHDPALAESLLDAWRNDNADELARLWAMASPLMVDA